MYNNNNRSRIANPNQRGYVSQPQSPQVNAQPQVQQMQNTSYVNNTNQGQWQNIQTVNNQNSFSREVNNQAVARGFNQQNGYNNAQMQQPQPQNYTANTFNNNNVNSVANNNINNSVNLTSQYNGSTAYNQQAYQGANNSHVVAQKPKFPYDKLVRRVFNAWEKGTNQCAAWTAIDFANLKNDLKKQKPFGYILLGAIAVVNIPYDETVRNYLRNKYAMTFCASGKFWGINANAVNSFMSDLQALSTTGLTLDDGTYYQIPKRQPKKADTSWSSVYQGGYKPQQQSAQFNSANQQNGYQQPYQHGYQNNYQYASVG